MDNIEYNAIRDFYGDRKAERSGVPLINHINEGLILLRYWNCSQLAERAWCLHPLCQHDSVVFNFVMNCRQFDSGAVAVAMEYRSRANAWLSDKVSLCNGRGSFDDYPSAGPLHAVKFMLMADKVQNYKDFLQYHKDTHPRRVELHAYFKAWFDVLGISDSQAEEFIGLLRS